MASQPPQRGAHEQLEGDHGRDGIARQREDGQRALPRRRNGREGDGLAGAHVDEPQVLLGSQLFEGRLDEIVLADGDARRGDQEIAAESPAEPRLDLLEPVGRHTERNGLAARLDDLPREGIGVGVGDLPGAQESAQVHDLVPRREDAHARLPHHSDLRMAEGGQQTELGRPDQAPALQH